MRFVPIGPLGVALFGGVLVGAVVAFRRKCVIRSGL